MDDAGADVIEVGVPFSDPLADGPTIQKAIQRSLDQGITIDDVFHLVESVREESDVPMVLMTYYNPVFRYGEQRFLDRAREAGADGVLVVDLPPEEGMGFYESVHESELDTVLLATPTTDPERVRDLSELSTGFLYYVSVTGVTGVRSGYNEELAEKIREVAHNSTVPTVMGFGISDVESIREYLDPIQGVVVGSALVELIEENLDDKEAMLEAIREKVADLANPLHGVTA
jgi:tryptophan synthase alpha chain